MTARKMRDADLFIVKAITIAPNTTKGERRRSLRERLSPLCTWLMSPVSLVIRVGTPMRSRSENESSWTCAKRALRSLVEHPTDAFAAKYCAVMEQTIPITPRAIKIKNLLKI